MTAGTHVHESLKQRIGERYLGGADLAAVAEAVALDVDTVTAALDELGITLRTGERVPLDPATVAAAYAEGQSIRAICRTTGRPYTTVHRALAEAGVTFRPRGARVTKRNP